jgi:hypothetical protein
MGTVLHFRTIRLQSRGVKQLKRQGGNWGGRAVCGFASVHRLPRPCGNSSGIASHAA